MDDFWEGFEKRAAGAAKGFLDTVAPHAKAMWAHAKPIFKTTGKEIKSLATKGSEGAMANPQRAMAIGAAGGALGTYALTRPKKAQNLYY